MTTEDVWDVNNIPSQTLTSMALYIERGLPQGDFLESVLTNDLRMAVFTADDYNVRALPAIVAYLQRKAPAVAWGSAEKYRAWIEPQSRND